MMITARYKMHGGMGSSLDGYENTRDRNGGIRTIMI